MSHTGYTIGFGLAAVFTFGAAAAMAHSISGDIHAHPHGKAPVLMAHHETLLAEAPTKVKAMHGWTRASIGKAGTGAIYLMLKNESGNPATVIGATTPVAERAELHTHQMRDGVAAMRAVSSMELAGYGQASLQPGATHIMLFGVREPLKAGTDFPLSLNLADGTTVAIEVKVMPLGYKADNGGHKMQHENSN